MRPAAVHAGLADHLQQNPAAVSGIQAALLRQAQAAGLANQQREASGRPLQAAPDTRKTTNALRADRNTAGRITGQIAGMKRPADPTGPLPQAAVDTRGITNAPQAGRSIAGQTTEVKLPADLAGPLPQAVSVMRGRAGQTGRKEVAGPLSRCLAVLNMPRGLPSLSAGRRNARSCMTWMKR